MPEIGQKRVVASSDAPRPEVGKETGTPPKTLQPWLSHRVDLLWEGRDQAVGTCPFCGREAKLYVSLEDGRWDCKVCGASGNAVSFLWQLHDASDKATSAEDYGRLERFRGLLDPQTLIQWQVAKSIITGDWLVPGYGLDRKIRQLYRYVQDLKTRKWRLYATHGIGHFIHGANLFDQKKGDVILTEGPWDGMVMWEVLKNAKREGDKLAVTGSAVASLLSDVNVLSAPGANVFDAQWCQFFAGKRVFLCYDNDRPRANPRTGQLLDPVGLAGMRRVSEILAKSSSLPSEVHYLKWGESGDGWNEKLPDGFDLSDYFRQGKSMGERVALLEQLLAKFRPIPEAWAPGRSQAAVQTGNLEADCIPCESWTVLQTAWRKAFKWFDGLDRALSCMLASIVSTKAVGDQLWFKIIGPPACGKSSLCEALAVNKRFVRPISILRGLHSGFKSDAAGKEDNSLLSQLRNMTLVMKDGDTLLQSPALGQILSEFRDAYDKVSRSGYRNKMGRNYEGWSMTFLLCGTNSLRLLDASELGERFLDSVIIDVIDNVQEDEIALRKAYQAAYDCALESDSKIETRDSPEMVKAKQLTGGYVGYLRTNAKRLLGEVKWSGEALSRCQRLGKFVAFMRARPSTRQEEKAERELSARLTSQLVKLAICLAAVLNRKEVDAEVMRRVKAVALDTARGRTLQIITRLAQAGSEGMPSTQIAILTGHSEEKERGMLSFLKKIGAVDLVQVARKGMAARPRWVLSPVVDALFKEVMS